MSEKDKIDWAADANVEHLCGSILAADVRNNDDLGFPLGGEGGDAVAVIRALAAERESLRSKLAEAERERDEAKNNILAWSDAHADMEASRDAALAELAKLRAEAEWRLISEAPQKASLFGSDVLLANAKQVTVGHPTRFDKDKFTMISGKYTPPTHFRPLPSPPKDPAHD